MSKKKMKLPFLAKTTQSSSSYWPFPSCHQPRTLSFRAANNDIFKTSNSAYLDATVSDNLESPPESFFTNSSSESASFSTASEDSRPIETVIRGLRSDRLFFEPDETSSILESKAGPEPEGLPFKDSVVLSMESQDPYVDFRKSMEEMVEAYGVKDWEGLEQLLCWYLSVNGKANHAYIVGAFVDLLVGHAFASFPSSSSSSSHSPSSPLSFYSSSNLSSSISTTTPCISCFEAEEEGDNPTPTSSSLLEEIKEEIKHQDEASSSSNV